jgi:hypothetical protein
MNITVIKAIKAFEYIVIIKNIISDFNVLTGSDPYPEMS